MFVGVCIWCMVLADWMKTETNSVGGGGEEIKPLGQWHNTTLLLMVRNEAAIIQRILRSAHGVVARRLFLCDTGSTDDTIERARQAWPTEDMVVSAGRVKFVNFEQARNACSDALIDAGTQTEWIALGDADFEARTRADNDDTPPFDVNIVQITPAPTTDGNQPQNALPMLVRASVFVAHCRYRLWTHEFLDCNDEHANITTGYYNGWYWIDHADGSSRTHKLKRDIALLRDWLREVNHTAHRPRALYYLARALEDDGQLDEARRTYEQHNEVQPYSNYIFYAVYRLARMELDAYNRLPAGDARRNDVERLASVERVFVQAHHTYDGYFRREPLYFLAWFFRLRGDYHRCVLYAAAALGTPAVDHTRRPLFLEAKAYGAGPQEEMDFCVQRIKRAV